MGELYDLDSQEIGFTSKRKQGLSVLHDVSNLTKRPKTLNIVKSFQIPVIMNSMSMTGSGASETLPFINVMQLPPSTSSHQQCIFQNDESVRQCNQDYENNPEIQTPNVSELTKSQKAKELGDTRRKRTYYPPEKLTRKRALTQSKWKATAAKMALNRGLEHLSADGKNHIPAKELREGCGPGCRFQCESKLGNEDRVSIHSQFWAVGDHSRQWDFIHHHTITTD